MSVHAYDELASAISCFCYNSEPAPEGQTLCLEIDQDSRREADDYVDSEIDRVAQDFADEWIRFRRTFEPDVSGQEFFMQLKNAGVSEIAAAMLKLDPRPEVALGMIRNHLEVGFRHLRKKKFERKIRECVFWERDRSKYEDESFLTVLDVFDPHWKPPLSVSVRARRLIVGHLRSMISQFESMELEQLTGLVQEHYQDGAGARKEQADKVKDVVAELKTALTGATSMPVHLVPYGSTTYGLSDSGSDLDCTVDIDGCDPYMAFGLLQVAFLELQGWKVLPATMKHVIQLECITRWPGFGVDLKVSLDRLGNENSELFGKLIRSDPRVLPLLMFLKQEFRKKALIRPPETFSSYAYMTMILSILTDLGVVPPLRRNISNLIPQWVSNCNVAHHELQADWISSNRMSIGELLLKVLHEMVTPNKLCSLTCPEELCWQGESLVNAAVCVSNARVDRLFICDFDDTLVRTSAHCKDMNLCMNKDTHTSESLPSVCIKEIVAVLQERKREGYFIAVVTGRSSKLQENVAEILDNNNVPFDELFCKPETWKQTTASYKADTVSKLASSKGCRSITLLDDSVEFLDAMSQAVPELEVQALLAIDGTMAPYTMKQATVVLCACPMTLQTKALLGRVCEHFNAVSVDIDAAEVETTEEGTKKGTNMGVTGPVITRMLVVDGRRLVFVISAAHRKKIKELSEYLPSWTTLVLLQPLKDPLVDCWSVLQKISQPEEIKHRKQSLPQSQWTIRVLDETIFEDGLQKLSTEQHRNLKTVFDKVTLDCKRCCEVGEEQVTSHRTIPINLQLFSKRSAGDIPKELQTVTQFIRKAKQSTEESINKRICRVLQEMACGIGYFADSQTDMEAACSEVVQELERVRLQHSLW